MTRRPAASAHPGRAAAVVLAGGSGTRLGATLNKVYLPLAGRRVVSWALSAFANSPEIGRIVLVIRPDDAELVEGILRRELPGHAVDVVHGGDSRHESEAAGVAHLTPAVRRGEIDVILVHDGARPFVTTHLIRELLAAARATGGSVPGLRDDNLAVGNPSEHTVSHRLVDTLVRMQTPQAFAADPLVHAYERAEVDGFRGTDTAACVEQYADLAISYVPGDPRNIKITFPEDLFLAEQILSAAHYEMR